MSINNYNLIKTNYHILEIDSKEFLFHIPTSSVFELSTESANLLRKMENKEEITKDEEEIVEEFKELNIVGSRFFVKEEDTKIEHFPAKALILNVTSGCNLSCTYCYKADLTSLKNSGQMTFEIAKDAIDMFYKESPYLKEYSITFFGGEPLSNLPLIKQIIAYANDFFESKGLKIGYSMTSNATLLTDEVIRYLHESKVDLTISIDGPESLHNKTRVYENGKGSYEKVAKNVAKLLDIYKNRTVGARVTLTRGVTDVKTIWNHLRYDLKFKEAGFAPATSGDNDFFNLSDSDLKKVFAGFKELGEDYINEAIKGNFNGFSNLHRTVIDIHEGRKKKLPCGAGVGLLSVSYKGDIDLCHRFTGSDYPSFGNIEKGLDKKALGSFLEKRANEKDTSCQTCRIRNLCAGGCYHESYIKYGTPEKSVLHYCDDMRNWIDFAVEAYIRIKAKNPEFFTKYFK